jgi:hypothetical protein
MEPLCPGYLDRGKWFQCYPPCGNAFLYECASIMCGWWFIDGMHRKNTLYASNEERRPPWLAKTEREEQLYGKAVR